MITVDIKTKTKKEIALKLSSNYAIKRLTRKRYSLYKTKYTYFYKNTVRFTVKHIFCPFALKKSASDVSREMTNS